MKQILFIVFNLCLLCLACSPAKKTNSSKLFQGISGQVTELKGNQMPMKNAPPAFPKGVKTIVFVYAPTDISQVSRIGSSSSYTAIATKQVASVETDSIGMFRIALPVGAYSLFVKDGDHFYANLFNTVNQIALFTVEAGRNTVVNLKVSSGASF